MNDEQFKILIDKLDFISNILVLNIINNLAFDVQVKKLFILGFKEVEITKILNSNRDKVHNVVRKLK